MSLRVVGASGARDAAIMGLPLWGRWLTEGQTDEVPATAA